MFDVYQEQLDQAFQKELEEIIEIEVKKNIFVIDEMDFNDKAILINETINETYYKGGI